MEVNGYKIKPYADLTGANLYGADLTGANLTDAIMPHGNIWEEFPFS